MDAVIAARRIAGAGTPAAAWRDDPQLRAVPSVAAEHLLAGSHRMVIVAPHPDDEILACGGLLQALAEGGVPALLVAVTDGEASHPGSAAWPEARLRAERPRETQAALACLGLAGMPVLRLALPDGAVAAQEAGLGARLAAILRPGDLVVTTWRLDAHPDHEACARACAAAAAACSARLLETPVWGWHWSAPGDGALPLARACKLALTPPMLARKRAAVLCFHSQLQDDAGRPAIVSAQAAERLLHPFELYFHDSGADHAG